jgi:hypothetical protein
MTLITLKELNDSLKLLKFIVKISYLIGFGIILILVISPTILNKVCALLLWATMWGVIEYDLYKTKRGKKWK